MKATKNEKGFTLIELVATMVILSIVISISFKKAVAITSVSEQRMLTIGVVELNTRESLTWFQVKLSPSGYENDENLWAGLDTNLSTGYIWETGPTRLGGTLNYGSQSSSYNRTFSNREQPGSWSP